MMVSDLSLTENPLKKLKTFEDIFYQVFLYCLATTVVLHGIAALVALRALRKHKLARYVPIVIAISGFLYPLTGGVITSALLAWIYKSGNFSMENYFAFVFGGGQAVLLLIISYLRVLATL